MDIASYFKLTIDKKASDLHLVGGSLPTLRINGDLVKISDTPIDSQELEKAAFTLISEKIKSRLERKRELDFSKKYFDCRFRVNLHYQEGMIALSARLIPENAPTPSEIGFDEVLYKLTHLNDGLILVTGPTGCGKSTTLAAMIDIINTERRSHIITIEDPIEFLFKEKQSIIEQRELGQDTTSFASALKYALRQDPNVIMVGEMRDMETVRAALIAAETGHLVLSTLHTNSAPETIERVISVFPAHQQQQVLNQLASVLRGVITQQLLPCLKGGRIAAREVMINSPAVANLIRENKIAQIPSVIQTSFRQGMITMNKSIEKLLDLGLISRDTANNRQRDLDSKAVYY